jgi:predicted secreted hydrolase
MDHEFSTSQLQPEQVGWDWVSLQMDDGTEWMLFQLRRKDGARDPHSAGSFVDRDGRAAPLAAEDFQMLPLAEWTSPRSGARYPIRWRIQVSRLNLDIEISAAMPDQELDTRETSGVVYWEGSIQARGQRDGRSVEGRGYLEMTGYAGPLPTGLYSPK